MANDKDLFSDIDLDGFDEKYLKRTKDALKAEKAKKADERIREFDSRPRSLAWATEALIFCARERQNGKDIADISDGMLELPRIQKEAEDIIEKDKEAKRLAAAQAEQAAKDKALADRIKATDERIREFAARKKTVAWANEAFGFCDREEANGKDIYAYSSGVKDLPRIRKEAQDVLDNDKKQKEIAKEQERLAKEKADEEARLEIIRKDKEAKQKAFNERVKAMDDRIRAFAACEKTVAWANEAFDFCDREEKYGKDIAAYSSQFGDLPRIRQLARDVLDAENARLAKAKADAEAAAKAAAAKAAAEKLAKEQAEAAAKKAAAEKAAAEKRAAQEAADEAERNRQRLIVELDEAIDVLFVGQKSRYWCEELRGVEARVKKAEAAVKLKMKNLHRLDEMLRLLPSVEEGISIDEQILELSRSRKKDEAWAKKALALDPQLTDGNAPYVKEQVLLGRYVKEANDILRQPTVTRFEKFLRGVEGGNAENLVTEYNQLKKLIASLGFALNDYISNFSARFAAAGNSVKEAHEKSVANRYERCLRQIEEGRTASWLAEFHELEKLRLNAYMGIPDRRIGQFVTRWSVAKENVSQYEMRVAEEKMRKEIADAEAAAAAAAAKAKADEELRQREAKAAARLRAKQKAKSFFVGSAVTLLVVAVLAALVVGAIVLGEYRHFFIGGAIAVAYATFWCLIRNKTKGKYIGWYIATNVGLAIACIPLYCFAGVARAYACGFAFAILLSAGLLISKEWKVYYRSTVKYKLLYYSFLIGWILFSIAIGLLFGGVAGMIIIGVGCGLAVVCAAIISCFIYDGEQERTFLSVFTVLVAVLAIAFLWDTSKDITLIAMGVGGGTLISALILWLGKGLQGQGLIGTIGGILTAGLAVVAFFCAYPTDEQATKIENGVLVSYTGKSAEYVIPEEVTAIGDNAFANNQKVKTIVFHDGVLSIGEQAFYNCDNLAEIVIPDSVVTISDKAFQNCDGLTTVTIGDGVQTIGNNAFEYCSNLKTIYVGSGVRKIGELAFHPLLSLGNEYTFIYNGTESQWNAIEKTPDEFLSFNFPWCYNNNIKEIIFQPKN